MKHFAPLLDIKAYKESFIMTLIMMLTTRKSEIAVAWTIYKNSEYRCLLNNHTRMMKDGKLPDFYRDNYNRLLGKFGEPKPYNELLGLSETEYALIDKMEHMCLNLNDVIGCIEMLKSFKNGVKNLKTCNSEYEHEKQYAWSNKDGNDKLSHKGNLPKAHFRWNYGTRYTLEPKTLLYINDFVTCLI